MSIAIERDVEEDLLKQRKRKRISKNVTYPMEYSKEMVDLTTYSDNWDFFFMKQCCRSLTMHQFEEPPKVVLDIACGSGLWIIEAANAWKDSIFTGFDYLKDIQPKLKVLPKDIAERVEWIHGSFLEPLPFPSNHFDMVRSVRIALHLPENEGQDLMDEIKRIMKPGAFYEVIDEDLIFPRNHYIPQSGPSSLSSAVDAMHVDLIFPDTSPKPPPPYSEAAASVSQLSLGSRSNISTESAQSSGPRSVNSGRSSQSWGRKASTIVETALRQGRKSDTSENIKLMGKPELYPLRLSEHKPPNNPRDHSRLSDAWDAMLRKRFLTPRVSSVLSLYLPMTFSNVKSQQTLQIPLPSNSASGHRKDHVSARLTPSREQLDPDPYFNMSGRAAASSSKEEISSTMSSQGTISSWAPMHLARVVRTIMGCKEAIWEAYQELFHNQVSPPPVIRSARFKNIEDVEYSPSSNGLRDIFETDWSQWENDMKDRIGIRGSITAELLWTRPTDDPPDWRVWRDTAEKHDDQYDTLLDVDEVDLCRSLRGYVCWKPMEDKTTEDSGTSKV